MKLTIFAAIVLLFTINANSQSIDNKLDIEIGFSNSVFFGNKSYSSDLSLKPYLFGEDSQSSSFCLGFSYRINKLYSAGLNLTSSSFDPWDYNGEVLTHSRESLGLLTFKPTVRFHLPKKFLNLFDLSLGVSPTINRLKFIGKYEYKMQGFDNAGSELNFNEKLDNTNYYVGADIGINLKTKIKDLYGIFLKGGYNHIFTSNSYFEESSINGYYFQLGINLHFIINKRHNY